MLGRGNAIKSTFDVNEKKTPLSKRPRAICVQRITLLLCFVSIEKILEGIEEYEESRILITRIHSRFRREYIRCTELYSTNHISPLFRIDRKDSIERNLRNPFAEDEGTRRWTELRIRPI